MTDLYLIAHCVRGETAFDVATKMMCPHCPGYLENQGFGCFDCEEKGYWWIIPTSGHRAFPYHSIPILGGTTEIGIEGLWLRIPEMPPSWPDHFKTLPAPKIDITSLFRAVQAKPHIARRL